MSKLPCEKCITKSMCKYKNKIRCSLLVKPYRELLGKYKYNVTANRIFEITISDFFGWSIFDTMVYLDNKYIFIENLSKSGKDT